jgi:hypothetical protein
MNKAFILVLGISAALISLTGATFSIMGLTKLFSGAPIAVGVMAGALELAKMVSASFLHRNWRALNIIMKVYLCMAVGILMCITSMGIFGYLSWAYQHTSAELKNTAVKMDFLDSEERKVQGEIDRLQRELDQIPANRITKKIETQKELEPRFQQLQKQVLQVQMNKRTEKLKMLAYQTEIGPVIYVAELFKANTDSVATWLILLFVIVFDPMAVCLVLATTFAITHQDDLLAAPPHAPPAKAA